MGYEITRALPLTTQTNTTPLTTMQAPVIAGRKLAIVPILRAGIGMSDGLLELVPGARSGHIGIYRAANHQPVEYLIKLPDITDRTFILCDPMCATGHSASYAVSKLIEHGVAYEKIIFVTVVAAPEGIQFLTQAHPQIKIVTAALDSHLDENAYIVPGLGNAGDRLFGTRH